MCEIYLPILPRDNFQFFVTLLEPAGERVGYFFGRYWWFL